MVFGDQSRGLTRRLLAARPRVALGVISYGVYLYHGPLLSWIVPFVGGHPWTWFGGTAVPALTIGTLALTLPVALLSYRYVEAPFLRLRYSIRGRVDLRVAALRGFGRGLVRRGANTPDATDPPVAPVAVELQPSATRAEV